MPKTEHTDPSRGSSSVVDFERIAADLCSPDERVRARAVGSLCPCRIGAQGFEPRMDLVRRAQKDPSPVVRAAAQHVLREAMEGNEGTPTNPRQVTNEILLTRFKNRWRRDESDVPAPHERPRWHRR